MIETKINKFLEDFKVDNITFKQNQTIKSKTKSNQENENFFYFTTIYVGNPSLKFQKHTKTVFQKYNIEIEPAYTSRKILNYFNNKSKCSEALDVNFIYKYTCSEDQNISYMGETSRKFFWQIEDHKGSDKNSAILQHIYKCESCQNTNIHDNFKFSNQCKKSNLYSRGSQPGVRDCF